MFIYTVLIGQPLNLQENLNQNLQKQWFSIGGQYWLIKKAIFIQNSSLPYLHYEKGSKEVKAIIRDQASEESPYWQKEDLQYQNNEIILNQSLVKLKNLICSQGNQKQKSDDFGVYNKNEKQKLIEQNQLIIGNEKSILYQIIIGTQILIIEKNQIFLQIKCRTIIISIQWMIKKY
ncbi:hypothetical protein pb186bvf_015712 [Paramecium bursaria]